MQTPYYQTAPTKIETTHATIAYWKVGHGPDLVFIHGWPLNSITYRGIVEKLATQFTCHLFDLPGAGQTIDKAPVNIEVILQSARELLTHLGLTRYALIAHDSGALIARVLAQDNPHVAALIMGNTEIPGHHTKIVQLMANIAKHPFGVSLLRQSMKIKAIRGSSYGFGGAFHSKDFIEGEFYQLTLASLLASAQNFDRAFSLLRSFDFSFVDRLTEIHQKIQAPVQMIWGAKDPIFPLSKANGMLSQFQSGATLDIIDKGRCFAHEEFPHEFASLALPLLRARLPS